MKWIFIGLIKVYQKTLSPMFGPRCKYYPSCSHYAIDAFMEYGTIKGLAMTAWRLVRCNPFSYGGVDYAVKKSNLMNQKNQKNQKKEAVEV